MKVYLVGDTAKTIAIKGKLEKFGIENIELKEDVKYRINKTDFVVTTNFKNQFQEYKKVYNLIIVTKNKDPKEVYQMISRLNIKDIILDVEDLDYLVKRIKRVIEK